MKELTGIARNTALLAALIGLTAPPLQSQQRTRSVGPTDAGPVATSFLENQLSFPRVSLARAEKKAGLEARFSELGIPFPPAGVYIRVFKVERVVEVWVQPQRGERYRHLVTYPVCAVSGWLGPKRGQGDLQIPEGFYEIESFNPMSEYHLSLRVNYPNEADRLAGMPAATGLGGDIYLHGGCETIGCVPITDDHIKELYWLAVEARAAGVRRIPVHIFPTRLDDPGLEWLGSFFGGEPELMAFWERMKLGYDFFQEEHRVPGVRSETGGLYTVGEAVEIETGVALLGAPVTVGPEGAVPAEAAAAPEASRVVAESAPTAPPAEPAKAPAPPANAPGGPVFLGVPIDSVEAVEVARGEEEGPVQAETPAGATGEPVARGLLGVAATDTAPAAEPAEAAPTDTSGAVPLLGEPVAPERPAAPGAPASDPDDVEAAAPEGPRLLGRPRLLGTALEDAPTNLHASFILPLRQRDGTERARHGIPWRIHVPRVVW